MANLTKLKEYNTPNKRLNFKRVTERAATKRNTPYVSRSGSITQSYLGFDVVKLLTDADAGTNSSLLEEVANLEQKTQDMVVTGEALRRKATQLAEQAEIRTATVKHVLDEAQKLGKAQNIENSEVIEFLKEMGISNTKADNKDALTGINGDVAYREEMNSFSDRVRKIYQGQEQKAIDSAKAEELSERLRQVKAKQTLLGQWMQGKAETRDIIEPHRELSELRNTRESNGEGKGSIFGAIGGFINRAVS